MLDIYTILMIGLALSLPLAVMLRIGVPQRDTGRPGERRALLLWWRALGVHALFWVLFVVLPEDTHAVWIVTINTLSVLALTLYVAAIRNFLGGRVPGWAIPATVGVIAACNLFYTTAFPDFGVRVVIVSGANMLWLGWGAYLLVRHDEPEIGRAAPLMVVVLLVLALTLLARTLEVLMHGVTPAADSLSQQISLAAFALYPVYASLAFFLMLGARANARLLSRARTDDLTGTLTRRAFLDSAHRRLKQARGDDARPVSMLLLDLDHFKAINDSHGHAVGDEVLRLFCNRLELGLRDSDLVGRLGGEEFAILLPGSDLTRALGIAERLRAGTEATRLRTNGEHRLSVSIGVAEWAGPPATLNQLLHDADQAMYRAKAEGRNRVVAHDPVASPDEFRHRES